MSASRRLGLLLREGVLSHHTVCPVCASDRRRPVPETARDNHYIRAIPLVAPITVEEVLDLLRVYRCEDCSASYCDPWLSRAVAARLYSTGAGQHGGGWQILHASVAGDDVPTHAHWQERTWDRIHRVAGPVSRYAELNCPFSGLLTHFRRRETDPREYRRLAGRVKRGLRSRRRHPGGATAAVRRLFEPRRPIRATPDTGPANGDLPIERVLVLDPSSACWGANCISEGVSCQALGPRLLAAAAVTSDDVRREGLRFDVSVLTQLDHQFAPMRVLERFLAISRLVVVACHLSHRFTKQHPFAFGPATAAFFAERGYYAVDATQETVHPSKRSVNQCLFVSREIRM